VNTVIAIGLCCLVMAGGVWLYLWWLSLGRGDRSQAYKGFAMPAEAQAQPPAEQATRGQPIACIQHRWSERRHRLALTENGLCTTGEGIRFCLDCAAEKTEAPFTEMEPT